MLKIYFPNKYIVLRQAKEKKIHHTENEKEEQHGSHRKIWMNPGAGKMLK
jgi:hypothetical protein